MATESARIIYEYPVFPHVCPVVEAPESAPASVVLKRVRSSADRPYDPEDTDKQGPAWRFFNDWAGVEFLSSLEARGGTELARPHDLAVRALAESVPDRYCILVLITDGQVSKED